MITKLTTALVFVFNLQASVLATRSRAQTVLFAVHQFLSNCTTQYYESYRLLSEQIHDDSNNDVNICYTLCASYTDFTFAFMLLDPYRNLKSYLLLLTYL